MDITQATEEEIEALEIAPPIKGLKGIWEGNHVIKVSVAEITPDLENPYRDDAINLSVELINLEASIKEMGILVPLHIREISTNEKKHLKTIRPDWANVKYILMDGERRYQASQLSFAGPPETHLPCLIVKDEDALMARKRHQTVANIKQRKSFDPWVLCKAFMGIMNSENLKNQYILADRIKESKQYVSRILSLNDLDPRIHEVMEYKRYIPILDDDENLVRYTEEESPLRAGEPKFKELPAISFTVAEMLLKTQRVISVEKDADGNDILDNSGKQVIKREIHKELAVQALFDWLNPKDPRRKLLKLNPTEKVEVEKRNSTLKFDAPRDRHYSNKVPRFKCEIAFDSNTLKPRNVEESENFRKKIKLIIPWAKSDDDIETFRDLSYQIRSMDRYFKGRIKGLSHEEACKESSTPEDGSLPVQNDESSISEVDPSTSSPDDNNDE